MGNQFCQEINDNDDNKFQIIKIKTHKYLEINSIIIILLLQLTKDELKKDELTKDELTKDKITNDVIKGYLNEKITEDTNEISLFVKTFYESKKMSLNMFCFYSNNIQIFRLDRNLENKIMMKGLDIKNINSSCYVDKITYSKKCLNGLLNINNADMEIIFNMEN